MKVIAPLLWLAQIVTVLTDRPVEIVQYSSGTMRILQANVRSLNTTKDLLELTSLVHRADLMLLQEIWSAKGSLQLRDFMTPLVKLRDSKGGGGVAIFARKSVKMVSLSQYDCNDVEAVWAEVMVGHVRCVVGSVYIPLGAIHTLKAFGQQLAKICHENDMVVLAMDANARNKLWDEEVGSGGTNKKMGDLLHDILRENDMEVLNDGTHTYHKGSYSAALDVTACKGLQIKYPVKWSVLDDDINSDHSPVITLIGESTTVAVVCKKDWAKMDWEEYNRQSEGFLQVFLHLRINRT